MTRGVWKIVVTALLLCLAAAACGSNTATQSPATSPSATTAVVTTQPSAATVTAQSPASSPAPTVAVAVLPSTADWPMLRGNAARTGDGSQGPVGGPVLRWRFQAKGSVNTLPVVVGGVVFAISDEGTLHALDAGSGKELWTFAGALSPDVGPTVWNGAVYVADKPGTIHAVDASTGQERWHSAAAIPGGLTIDDGGIYVASNGAIVALDPATGAERWRYAAPAAGLFHNPALANGLVYAGSDLGGVVAVDAVTGTLRWHADTGSDATSTAVVANGIAYVGDNGSAKGHLYAFDAASGNLLWRLDQAIFSPAVSGGVAYSGSAAGYVSARNAATGHELWRFPVKGEANPVSFAAGVIYVAATGEHRVYALDAGAGRELWHFDLDGGTDATVAVAGGSVYIGTASGSVYAIGGNGLTAAAPSALPSASPSPTALASAASPSPASSPSAATASPSPAVASAIKFLWAAKGGPGGMTFPGEMALASDGRIWVADTGNNRFAIFNPDGSFVETWGSSGSGNGQFNLSRSNGDGYGMLAFAADGSFYVLDVGNRRVQHFDKTRKFLGTWGTFGTGPGQFTDPIGIGVDAKGTVYVVDDVRDVVEKYDPKGTVLGSFSPHLAGFNSTNSLALDAAGNVYVSDIDTSAIEKFDPSGKLLSTFGTAGTGPGQFNGQPGSVAVDADGRVFAADGYPIRVFDKAGSYVTSLDSSQPSDGGNGFATGMLLDGHGALYVSVTGGGGGDRIEKFQLQPPLTAK